ncbi:X-domain of DnaJ-containing-domain-containing protein [Lactarius pseudohatsudake]|nr:X-domain of DnaJ-containing-domain-containing protein [Lactarius pseudohatsudake]
MAPVETEYYDLVNVLSLANTHSALLSSLGVPVDFNDTDLKKAYRKAAMRICLSPPRDTIGPTRPEAYRVLSDSNGKKMVSREGGPNIEDAASFFANVFGSERFMDYIREISLMKDMTNVANTMLSEEEEAEAEAAANGAVGSSATASTSTEPHLTAPPIQGSTSDWSRGTRALRTLVRRGRTAPFELRHTFAGRLGALCLCLCLCLHPVATDKRDRRDQRRLGAGDAGVASPEETLQDDVGAVREARGARAGAERALGAHVRMLTDKLIERLRPFVGAKNPGGPGDPETAVWEARMRREADDLRLESFGVELLHAIGTVYVTKATAFRRARGFRAFKPFFLLWWEKGAVAKDAWGVIGSALSVQQVMQDIERAQLKDDVGDEELKALEIDVTGKIMLASWRGTRFEVVQVLREVNVVLKDHIANNQELYHRTRGLLLLGAIFKSTVPDESDEERRELERMIAEVAKPKKKQAPPSAAAQAGAKAAHDVRHGHANGHWHTSPAATDAKFTDAKSSF